MSPEQRPELIAHNIRTPEEAKIAISNGFTLIELDISKRAVRLTPESEDFPVQHHGLKGLIGKGPSIREFVERIDPVRILWDLKHFNFGRRNGLETGREFGQILIDLGISETNICGTEHMAVSAACEISGSNAFYSLSTQSDIRSYQQETGSLVEPTGFCIKSTLATREIIDSLRNGTERKIFVWKAKGEDRNPERLERLGISGVIVSRT